MRISSVPNCCEPRLSDTEDNCFHFQRWLWIQVEPVKGQNKGHPMWSFKKITFRVFVYVVCVYMLCVYCVCIYVVCVVYVCVMCTSVYAYACIYLSGPKEIPVWRLEDNF